MRAIYLVGLITLLVGCSGGDGTPPAGDPDANVTTPDAEPPGCQSNDDCAEPGLGFCAADGACVACLVNADCPDVSAPTCDQTTRSCRGCVVDDDCDTLVCNPDNGECAAETDVYYVDDDAACAAGDGSLATPFCTVLEAQDAFVASYRPLVHVMPGAYDFPPILPEPSQPTFHGHADAILRPQLDGVCFRFGGTASVVVQGFRMVDCDVGVLLDAPGQEVVWYGATIVGGDRGFHCEGGCRIDGAHIEGTNQAVRCETTGTCRILNSEIVFNTGTAVIGLSGAEVTIDRTRIADVGYAGILTADSSLILRDSVVEHTGLETMDAAVMCDGPSCVIQRSRIRSASGPGIRIEEVDDWTIENCAIVENGTIIAGEENNGGVVINHIGLHRFSNNTIYGNKAGAGEVAGIRCLGGTTVANSIVWGNGTGDQADDGCVVTSSAIDQETDALLNNFRMDPMITNTTPGLIDEHLLVGSPCIDRANSAAATDDIDGEPRTGGVPDVGADERMR